MVTAALAHVSWVSAEETNAFLPHPYAQATHINILKLQKEKQNFPVHFK